MGIPRYFRYAALCALIFSAPAAAAERYELYVRFPGANQVPYQHTFPSLAACKRAKIAILGDETENRRHRDEAGSVERGVIIGRSSPMAACIPV